MPKTGKLDRDQWVACALVVVVHALLGWAAPRLLAVRVPAADSGRPLQLFWVAAPPAPGSASPGEPALGDEVVARPDRSRLPRAAVARSAASAASARVGPPMNAALTAADGLSAVYIDQAARWARQQAPIEFVQPDPLARQAANLPGAPGRLQLRESLTVADAVGVVAGWFGGPGYTTDACPELRKDVNDLSLAGDSAALQDALYYEKRGCW